MDAYILFKYFLYIIPPKENIPNLFAHQIVSDSSNCNIRLQSDHFTDLRYKSYGVLDENEMYGFFPLIYPFVRCH